MGKTKKEAALWMVLTQGGLVSIAVYFLGLLGLSALVMKGTVGEGRAFAVVVALDILAAFLGGLVTVRRTPWGGAVAGLVTGTVFAAALAIAGLAFWGNIAVLGRGGVLVAGAVGGSFLAGLVCGRKRKRGKRAARR